jgi:hypothetical protein
MPIYVPRNINIDISIVTALHSAQQYIVIRIKANRENISTVHSLNECAECLASEHVYDKDRPTAQLHEFANEVASYFNGFQVMFIFIVNKPFIADHSPNIIYINDRTTSYIEP